MKASFIAVCFSSTNFSESLGFATFSYKNFLIEMQFFSNSKSVRPLKLTEIVYLIVYYSSLVLILQPLSQSNVTSAKCSG